MHIDVDRAERKYRNRWRAEALQRARRLQNMHYTHIDWPPELVARLRRLHTTKRKAHR
jgi:hypothetical protein